MRISCRLRRSSDHAIRRFSVPTNLAIHQDRKEREERILWCSTPTLSGSSPPLSADGGSAFVATYLAAFRARFQTVPPTSRSLNKLSAQNIRYRSGSGCPEVTPSSASSRESDNSNPCGSSWQAPYLLPESGLSADRSVRAINPTAASLLPKLRD
jgi:hypothetical protein